MENNRDTMKIVVVGHVDHGKSTVIGRLLYDTNSLPEGTINKVKKIAKETGKPFEYAYLLDAFEEEQKQGITIDTTSIQFQTPKRDYVIIDAPGHKEFLKNMISGAANAEAALLVIDGKEGVQEQSKRHAYILSLLGIQKVYIIVNKMDLLDYSEEAFNNVVSDMKSFLNDLEVYPLDYIPVSAFYGENILTKSEKMRWYKGQPILESIDLIQKDKGIEEKPLRFPIQDVYKFDDRRIIAGRIEQGTLNVGDQVTIYPEGKTTTIKSVENWVEKDKSDVLKAGQSVGVTFTDEFFNKRGEVIVKGEFIPYVSKSFRANIFWMGKNALVKGKSYKMKFTTQEVEGEIDSIVKIVDSSSLDSNSGGEKININDVAEVIIKTKDPVAFDLFKDSQITGRFVIVDGYDVAGGGIIVKNEGAQNIIHNTFVYNDISARGDIFEEFYYSVDNLAINKKQVNITTFTIGDSLPLKTDSYEYPAYFDILILRDNVAITVRGSKISNISTIEEYVYKGYPVVNGRGFKINISTSKQLKEFIDEAKTGSAEALNKWVKFDEYRKVSFK